MTASSTIGAGIGGGSSTCYSGGSLTVTGGYVKATSTKSSGIGGGKGTAVVIDGGIVDAALDKNDTLKNSAGDTLNTTRTTASITGIAGDTVPTAITYTKSDGTAVSYGCKGTTVALLGTPGIYLPAGAALTGATAAEKDYAGSIASGSGGTLAIKDPTVVWNASLVLGGSTGAETYQLGNNDKIPYVGKITLKTDGAASNSSNISIGNGGYVIFDHVNYTDVTAVPPLYIISDPTLELKGDNTLGTLSGDCITVYIHHTLTIKGAGSLTLNSGAIGSSDSLGTLIIESGTLHANQPVSAGAVKIGGGNIDANFSVQPVKESDPSVPVYKTEVALYDVYGASAAVTNASLPGYDFSGIKTDENGKIYLYLPAGAVSIQFGSTTLSGTIAENNDNVLAPAVSLGLVSGEAQCGLTTFTLPVNSQSGGTVYYAVSDTPLTSAAAMVSAAGENYFVSDGSKRALTFSGLNPGTEYTVYAVENMPGHYYSGIASAAVTTLPLGLLYNGAEKIDWYTGDVTLTASGYTICDSENGTYADSYTVSETCVNKTLYFQKNGEKFSVPVSVNIDKTAPTGRITVGTHWWEKLLETITFNYYNANQIQISAADEQSGIAKIDFTTTGLGSYTAAELKELPEWLWVAYDDAKRPIAAEGSEMVVYARITNQAGLVTYLSSDGLIADTKAPTVTASAKETLDVSATLSIKASEDADVYYYCTNDASESVDAQKLLAQTKNTLKGNTAADFTLSGLTPDTAYKFYSMAVDRATNASVIDQYSFSTAKTLPTVTVKPTASSIVYGDSLSQSTLAGGSASVPGHFAWSDPSYAPSQVKDGKAVLPENACVFLPDDTNLYAQRNVDVTVGVNRRPITIETASVSDKTYDGTNAAAVSAVTFANTAFGQTLAEGVDYKVTAHYNSADAGNSVSAVVSVVLIQNDKTANYSIPNPNSTVSGKITPESVQYSIPGEQTVRIGSGLNSLQAPEKGTGLGQDTISGALRWHLGSAAAPVLDDSFAFSGNDGEQVTLYWDFTPDGSMTNYSAVPVTGSVAVTLAEKEQTRFDITVSSDRVTYETAWEVKAALSKATSATDVLDGTVEAVLTRADGTTVSLGTFPVKDGNSVVTLSMTPGQLPVGEYDVTFTYSGNKDYQGVTDSAHVKVNPAPLGYDLSGVHAVKEFDGTAKADITGTVSVTGVLPGEDAGFSYTAVTGEYMSASVGKQQVTLLVKGIKVSNPNYVFLGEDFPEIEGEILGTELPINGSPAIPQGDKIVLHMTVRVPEALAQNPDLNTPDKIERQLRLGITKESSELEKNMMFLDVDLYQLDSNGTTWSLASPADMPAEGLQLVLPYPEGTDAAHYDFTVMHMISFGPQAGTLEKLSVTKGTKGLIVTMHSFSPIALAYAPVSAPAAPDDSCFNVISTAGKGGTITTDALMPAAKYSSVTYTITPEKGYVIADVLVDGVSVGAVESYTFSQLMDEHTISASFRLANGAQNPNTGDPCGRGITLAAAGIFLSAAAGVVICRKKRES